MADDARARSNVKRLAAAQALTGANSAVIFATGSIVGATLAPSISLATVPLSMYVLGLAAGTLPTGAISRAFGRRVAFIIGTGCGVVTGLLASFAILHGSFVLFCCATFLGGLYGSVSQSYRFAAADGVSAVYRPKAVSLVMAGGVFAGVLGPQLVQWTMDIWPPYLFAFSFVVQAVVALIAMAILSGVDTPKPAASDLHLGRPLFEIVRQPRFIAAAICGIVSYPVMNLVMTSVPLAMKMCGLSVSDSNFGIQWHIVAIYGPSFFTGWLIARFGAPKIVATGLLLEAGAATVGLTHGAAFLGHPDRARARMESRFRRRLGAGAGNASAARAQQGAGLQRFSGVRDDGGRIVFVRPVAGELRLVRGQPRGISAGAARARGIDAGIVGQAAAGQGAGGARISRSSHLIRSQSQALEVSCRRENTWMNSSPSLNPAIMPARSSAITPKILACRRT
jgi:MFS family permease